MKPTYRYNGFIFDLDTFEEELEKERFVEAVNAALPINVEWNPDLSAIIAPYDMRDAVDEIRERWNEICSQSYEKAIE